MPDFELTVSSEEFFSRFADESMSAELCKKCPEYGVRWSCPPYAETLNLRAFSKARIVVRRVDARGDVAAAHFAERAGFDALMLSLERKLGGVAFFAGKCANCALEKCPRAENRPCAFPEKMRRSLEGAGFDVSRAVSELFGEKIEWDKGGAKAKSATLVAALFFG
ncbi:MAG: hypothetical protein IJI37_06800 [Opitutales bacterium]|nr:hypothetical protein [Opitutales bacterium]